MTNPTLPRHESVNQVNLVGQSTDDADVRFTAKGVAVSKVRLLTTHGKCREFTYCVGFRDLATEVARVKKDDWVALSGYLQTSSFSDKRSGETRYSTSVVITKIEILAEQSALPLPDYDRESGAQ